MHNMQLNLISESYQVDCNLRVDHKFYLHLLHPLADCPCP